jgi:hypothetical protein
LRRQKHARKTGDSDEKPFFEYHVSEKVFAPSIASYLELLGQERLSILKNNQQPTWNERPSLLTAKVPPCALKTGSLDKSAMLRGICK